MFTINTIRLAAGLIAVLMLAPAGIAGEKAPDKAEETAKPVFHVDALYGPYLELQIALSGDDFKKTQAPVKDFQEALKGSPDQLAKKVSKSDLETIAKACGAAKDIDALRTEFHKLSKKMIRLLKSEKYAGTYNPKIYYCSMAFNNKGAKWLQDSDTLFNPYWGAEMLHCGNKVKDIAKK